jgi:hypothetical protein
VFSVAGDRQCLDGLGSFFNWAGTAVAIVIVPIADTATPDGAIPFPTSVPSLEESVWNGANFPPIKVYA